MPSVVVGGTIQPKILPELMAESRGDDGFSHRLLFCFPHAEAKPWNRKEQQQSMFTGWDIAMKKLMALPYECGDELKPQVLKFTPEAKELLHNWQEIVAGERNGKRSSYVKGVYAKIEHYAIRFSLIMQLMRYASGEGGKERIDVESVGAAIKLAEYFKLSHLQVYEEMHSYTPLDDLPEDKYKIYRDLPDEFKKSEGLAIAAKLGFAERTFERFIANPTYFKKLRQGMYAKQL